MTEKTDEKPERKAPEPLSCSKCNRKKGQDGVTIYARVCSICRKLQKSKAPEPGTKAPGGETKPAEPETKGPVLTKEPCHPDKKTPSEEGEAPSDREIIIKVDFTRYPKIHERLLKLAEAEFRTPDNQLLYLLDDHLAGLEEKA